MQSQTTARPVFHIGHLTPKRCTHDWHIGPFSPRPDLTIAGIRDYREAGFPEHILRLFPEQQDCAACLSSIGEPVAQRRFQTEVAYFEKKQQDAAGVAA